MNQLVIVGRYPFHGRRLEGMVQRISSVDSRVSAKSRTYLDLYVFKRFRGNTTSIGNCDVFTGSFIHFWHILKILRGAKVVYVHSVYFYALIMVPLLFVGRSVKMVLDIHGAVPEELHYSGNPGLSAVMGVIERFAFSRAWAAVCVTRKMEQFYRAKYANFPVRFLYFPIFTANVCKPADPERVAALRLQLGIPKSQMVCLYSGGLQAWQNVDKMMDIVRVILGKKENWCIFLTGEAESLTEMVRQKFEHVPERLLITHAAPGELRNYYELANFGFILREDHLLNRVASPTKMIEYLYFGVVPIVWSSEIGDFKDLGYDFLSLGDLDGGDLPCSCKSDRNRQISRQLIADAERVDMLEFLGWSTLGKDYPCTR